MYDIDNLKDIKIAEKKSSDGNLDYRFIFVWKK